MKELINDPLFQMVAGIVISAILSVYLTIKYSSRKSVLFEINNVFQLSDNRLSSFKRLDISINGKRILEDNTRIFLVEFEFTNIGNRDIRFSKDDGQFLKLTLDKQFEIIDISNEDLGILDLEKNAIDLNIKSFKTDEKISIQAIIQHKINHEVLHSKKIELNLLPYTKLEHDIHDMKKIRTERMSNFVASSILLIGFSFLLIYLSCLFFMNNGNEKLTLMEQFLGGATCLFLGLFFFRIYFQQRKMRQSFNKRQNG